MSIKQSSTIHSSCVTVPVITLKCYSAELMWGSLPWSEEGKGYHTCLVLRPYPHPAFDRLQYAKTELHIYLPLRSFVKFCGKDETSHITCCSGLFLLSLSCTHSPLPHTSLHMHMSIGSLSSIGSLPDQFGQLSMGRGRGRGRGFAYGAVRQPKTVGGLQQSAVSRE